MLGRKKDQLKFTDIDTLQTWEQKPIIPKDSIYYGLSQANEIFKDELFADAYSFSGRPSIPPGRLIKVLLLQFYDKVSDREAPSELLDVIYSLSVVYISTAGLYTSTVCKR